MKAQRLFPWMMEDSSEGVEIEVAVRSQFLHTVVQCNDTQLRLLCKYSQSS
jgi:hypothetical protein